MKILQVIPFFSPKFGGSVTVLYDLSKELAKRKHDVTIITTDFGFDPQYADTIRTDGVTVISFKAILNFGLFIYTPSMKSWLRDNIKDFDVIHMHNFRSYQNNIVYRYAMQNHIPYIVQPQGTVLPFFEKQALKRIYDICWGKQILKNASNLFASSKNESDQIQSMGVERNKITIVPTCLDLSEFNNLPQRGTFKAKYGIKPNEKVILFLGRIHKIKGIDLLIDAFFDLSNEMDDIKLVIIGPDGGLMDSLLKKVEDLNIREKIIFTGMIHNFDKFAAYVDAEIYVLPSKSEAFGLTVLEAWACGTPVIISEGCLISEFLPNKEIIFKRDKNQLKNLLKKIFQDNGLKTKLQNEGKELLKNQFNWSKGIENYIFIYSDLIKKRAL